jgi:hypothetical protein
LYSQSAKVINKGGKGAGCVFVVVLVETMEERHYAAERRRRWKEYRVERAEDYGSEWCCQDGESDLMKT